MRASELKRGHVVAIGGKVYMVREVQAKSPSSRGATTLYKVTFREVVSRQKLDQTFKGDDLLDEVALLRRPVQYLYSEGDATTFMDTEDYQQYTLDDGVIEAERPYLVDGLEGLMVLLVEGRPVGLDLPGTVEMEVTECAPSMKGGTAAARTKPATLTTGLVVQVPEYISTGERIKVNTATGEFVSRA